MQHSPVRVLLIVDDARLGKRYRHEVEKIGAICDVVPNVAELYQILPQTAYHGILLDVPTSIRAKGAQIEIVNQLMERYPTLRLLYDPASDSFRTMLSSKPLVRGMTLERFLNEYCREAQARAVRRYHRTELYFRALLSRQKSFPVERTERTFTLDISLGGCFVFTPSPWSVGEGCWLKFPSLGGMVVLAEVRRLWGWEDGVYHPPGVGLKFLDFPLAQQEVLLRELAPKGSCMQRLGSDDKP